jgi:hypothetical protein
LHNIKAIFGLTEQGLADLAPALIASRTLPEVVNHIPCLVARPDEHRRALDRAHGQRWQAADGQADLLAQAEVLRLTAGLIGGDASAALEVFSTGVRKLAPCRLDARSLCTTSPELRHRGGRGGNDPKKGAPGATGRRRAGGRASPRT